MYKCTHQAKCRLVKVDGQSLDVIGRTRGESHIPVGQDAILIHCVPPFCGFAPRKALGRHRGNRLSCPRLPMCGFRQDSVPLLELF